MHDALVPACQQSSGSSDVGSRLMVMVDRDHLGLSEDMKAFFSFYLEFVPQVVAKIEALHPHYLALPATIAVVSSDPMYAPALPWGRFTYGDDLLVWDEEEEWFRSDEEWTRAEIADLIEFQLHPPDLRLSACLPLAWSVGFLLGWLSALSESQPDDAQAGLVLLAALVAPLLLHAPGDLPLLNEGASLRGAGMCKAGCGRPVKISCGAGRPARFCSDACKMRCSRARRAGVGPMPE